MMIQTTPNPKRGRGRPPGSDRRPTKMSLPPDVYALLDEYQAAMDLPSRTAAVEALARRHVPRTLRALLRARPS